MFTGIVQDLGTVRGRVAAGEAIRFTLASPRLAEKLQVGDSVACDGVCLTVERVLPGGFSVCAVPETLSKSTLSGWKSGDTVNLEPAATPQTALGGHFVLGHADGVCEVVAVKSLPRAGLEFAVALPESFLQYCPYKGSLALSGVSLTIAAVEGNALRFAVIPHTLQLTNLGNLRKGQRLNFEVDILAKYVERQMSRRGADPAGDAGASQWLALEKWGYGVS